MENTLSPDHHQSQTSNQKSNQVCNPSPFSGFQPKNEHRKVRRAHHHEKPIVWTTEEDDELSKLVQLHGHKWIQISKYFPNRTEIQIKNRWYSNQRREERRKKCQIKTFALFVSPSQIQQPNKTDIQNLPPQNFWDKIFDESSFLQEFNALWMNEMVL